MERFISLFGLAVLIAAAWAMSSNRKRIDWKLVGVALLLQFALAALVLGTPPGRWLFDQLGQVVSALLHSVQAGSKFIFGFKVKPTDKDPSYMLLGSFAFGVLPTIIFFSSLMAILYYFGVMQKLVAGLAWIMQRTLKTSGAESLAAACNVFVGHTEAPLVIRPYIAKLTMSELNAVMVGGFATISGGLLAVYAGMGVDPGHLLTASVISAPAGLLIAKILQPETETPETIGMVKVDVPRQGVNVVEAAAIGASDGLKLALNVGAMLLAFLALMHMADAFIIWLGDQLGLDWSLAKGLGTLFYPVAFLMGIPSTDCMAAGELLGLKTFLNEFVAFERFGDWVKQDPDKLSPRSRAIITYALSGFSNFGAIGIQIGGIGGIAPTRQPDIAKLGLRAMVGGAIACCMTACVAGLLLP